VNRRDFIALLGSTAVAWPLAEEIIAAPRWASSRPPISPVLGRSGMRESPGRRFGAFSLSAPGARVSAFSSLGHFSAGELAGDGAACILIIVTQIICGLAR
jgi:hypothetical protein